MVSQQLRKQWTEAHALVGLAEERLEAAWALYAQSKGPLPPEDLLAEVSRLRIECDQRLVAVLLESKVASPIASAERVSTEDLMRETLTIRAAARKQLSLLCQARQALAQTRARLRTVRSGKGYQAQRGLGLIGS